MPPPKDDPTPNFLELDSDYWTNTVHSDTYPAISPLKSNLQGTSVFISGASKGLGKALAISYAQAGASKIALGARSSLSDAEEAALRAAKEANRPAPSILKLTFDVTSQASVESAAAEVEKSFGGVDIVINSAGILDKGDKITDLDPDEWWNVMTVNLRGPLYVSRFFLPLVLKSKNEIKYLINVASCGAHLISPGRSAYQPSKTALVRLTEFAQKENAGSGLVAFSCHPGNMVTEILGPIGTLPDSMKHIFVDTVELAADTLSFLTSKPRPWLGGRYINCTWDMPEFLTKEEEIVKGDKLKMRLDWK